MARTLGTPRDWRKILDFPGSGLRPAFFYTRKYNLEMEWEQIPKRVFLDTNVLNFIFDYGEYIFDGLIPAESFNHYIIEDINAFHNIFLTGKRATWQIAISDSTYEEVIKTRCLNLRYHLEMWFVEVWSYWSEILKYSKENALITYKDDIYLREYLLSKDFLECIPYEQDRNLICDAIIYRCDYFCTRDWKTILKYRDKLKSLPIKIITPKEWWQLIYPFAGLFA